MFGRWILSTAFDENLARVGVVATLAEVEGVRAEPWTATWEHYYDRFIADVGPRYGWCAITAQREVCAELRQRQPQVAQAAREVVLAHPWAYVRAHARGVLFSVLDPGHQTWYRALTGRDWETAGVVNNLWKRIAWSLERGAVGDALGALWSERVARPPVAAALIWWGLAAARVAVWTLAARVAVWTLAARVAVWTLAARGAWRLRHRPWAGLMLILTIAYLVVLPGPIAYDRFYLPAIPAVVVLVALGTGQRRFFSFVGIA